MKDIYRIKVEILPEHNKHVHGITVNKLEDMFGTTDWYFKPFNYSYINKDRKSMELLVYRDRIKSISPLSSDEYSYDECRFTEILTKVGFIAQEKHLLGFSPNALSIHFSNQQQLKNVEWGLQIIERYIETHPDKKEYAKQIKDFLNLHKMHLSEAKEIFGLRDEKLSQRQSEVQKKLTKF